MPLRQTARLRPSAGRRVVRPLTAAGGRLITGSPPSPLVGPLPSPVPPVEPPPGPEETTIDGYSPYNADVFTHVDGYRVARNTDNATDSFFSIVSQTGEIVNTIPQRRYTATAQVKAGAQGVGKQMKIAIRERDGTGTVVAEVTTFLTITASFQTFSVVHDATSTGNTIDARVSFQGAVADDEFIISAAPAVDVLDDATPPPVDPPSGSAFDAPYWPGSLWRQRVDSLGLEANSSGMNGLVQSTINSGLKVTVGVEGETPSRVQCGSGYQNYTVTASWSGYSGVWRVPPTAQHGGGADYPIILYDPDHPTHGEFVAIRLWQATINHGARTISATNSGLFRYNNDGRILSGGIHSVGRPFSGGGAGNGLSYDAGQVLRAETEAMINGDIEDLGHTIRVACPQAWVSAAWRPPATKSDQGSGNSNAHQMGTRWRIPSSVNPDSRTVPTTTAGVKKSAAAPETKFLRGIIRTGQRYGFMTSDGSAGWTFYLEAMSTAKWTEILPETYLGTYSWILRDNRMSDIYSRNSNDGVPWNNLEFVQWVADTV